VCLVYCYKEFEDGWNRDFRDSGGGEQKIFPDSLSLTMTPLLTLQFYFSLPVAKWLNLSAADIAQLAHAADESIRCREGWRRCLFSNYCEQSCCSGGPISYFGPPTFGSRELETMQYCGLCRMHNYAMIRVVHELQLTLNIQCNTFYQMVSLAFRL